MKLKIDKRLIDRAVKNWRILHINPYSSIEKLMRTRRIKARSLALAHVHTHERTYDRSSNVVRWKMKMTLKFMHIWEKLTSGGETKSNDESFRNSKKIYITLNSSQKLINQFVDHFFGAIYVYFLVVDSIEFGDVDGLFDLSGCFIWN